MMNNQQINTFPYANRLGHYRIIKKIGQGGMSSVYEGFDEKLQRSVAIKILHPFLAEQEEHKKRFFKEAQAGAKLSHPNIIQIHDVAVSENKEPIVYIVTELIKGITLKQFVQTHSLKEIPEFCCMLIWQIACALEHAHQKGIIHRDIKSENIMIREDGIIKLMDFGIASILDDENLTQTGALIGSFAYMAPEIIQGNKASIRSDIFSLSVVFYWLLCEKMPFVGNSHHTLLKKIVDEEALKLQSLSSVIVDELAEIVEKGMHKNPQKRYSSMEEFKSVLEKFLFDFSIVIDEQLVIKTLKNPQLEIEKAHKKIIKQIKYQLKIYQNNKNKIKCAILLQRINSRKRDNNYFSIAFIMLFLIFIFSIFIFSKYKKNKPVYITESSVTPNIIVSQPHEIEQSLLNHESEVNVEKCEVSIAIWPFATVILNNQQIAENAEKVNLKLNEGKYNFIFLHPYAVTYEKSVEIKKNQKKISFKVNLIKTKPAFLVIDSLVDADIVIDDQYHGTTKSSLEKPIILQMPDKKHAKFINLSLEKEGYQTYTSTIEVEAGITKKIKIFLEKNK